MPWFDEAVRQLLARPVCGYRRNSLPAVEPTALAALAIMAAGPAGEATAALDWLSAAQSGDGSLGVDARTPRPCWPTGWAIVAWNHAAQRAPAPKAAWSAAAVRAADWLLSVSGQPIDPSTIVEEDRRLFGHDTTLLGWPWVEGTHSWVEPTAIGLLALRSAGRGGHPRCREAVKLLLDRQLPGGGWNFGNTTVLGHLLRPQVEPTGLTLAALAQEADIRPKVQRSLDLLLQWLSPRTTTASLGYALLGLAGHGLWPPQADDWLRSASQRAMGPEGSPYHLALLVLAAARQQFVGGDSGRRLTPS